MGEIVEDASGIFHTGQNVVGLLHGAPVLRNFGLMSELPNTVKLSFFSSGLLGAEFLPFKDSPLNELANSALVYGTDFLTGRLESKYFLPVLAKCS